MPTREQYRQMDFTVLVAETMGILIGWFLRGSTATLGVCVVLKLFGVV